MILDVLEHAAHYDGLGAGFAAGFAYLRGADLARLADGRYDIDGPRVVAIVQGGVTRPRSEGRWESHREHADIQYVVRGAERMGVTTRQSVTLQPPYDAKKDVEFYAGGADVGQFFEVAAGAFAVFFPHDVHMPSLAMAQQPHPVKKVVIKVRLR